MKHKGEYSRGGGGGNSSTELNASVLKKKIKDTPKAKQNAFLSVLFSVLFCPVKKHFVQPFLCFRAAEEYYLQLSAPLILTAAESVGTTKLLEWKDSYKLLHFLFNHCFLCVYVTVPSR